MEHSSHTLGGDTLASSMHVPPRRGRPAKVVQTRDRELRLTPIERPDDPIEWFTQPGILKIAAFEEGGHGTEKKLHYHAIVTTTMTDDALKSYCYKLTRGKGTEGNKAFMSREIHENTCGYISKHRTPVHLIGYTESDLNEWYTKSDEYVTALKRERDAYRKTKALGRKRELLSVEQDIKTELENFPSGEYPVSVANYVVERFIDECAKRNFDFPTRTQMEGIVNRLRFKYDPGSVYAFYRRNLNVDYDYTQNALNARNERW